jgi:hypothetical protein
MDKQALEYDEAGYEALEHRAFEWRDWMMDKRGYDAERALKLAWRIVNHEENKDPYGY